jgi:NAD+ synthase
LWGEDRTDEDQIGASYPELEWAMDYIDAHRTEASADPEAMIKSDEALNERDQQVLRIYWRMHRANRHKMDPIPVCSIPPQFK